MIETIKKYRPVIAGLLALGVLLAAAMYLRTVNFAVLDPKGVVGEKERQLMVTALLLSVVIVVPVFALLFTFAWKYRAGNKKAKYSPELDGSRLAETIWWVIPSVLIIILSVLTWRSSHELDPFRPLASTTKPLNVQVVALDWKWLFIYPDQNVASVNFLQIPEDTPINFSVTSDTVMNSFWIPQLGGQIYAMPGMSTKIHLEAREPGSYRGLSANISGVGFSRMTFTAKAGSRADFNAWVRAAKAAGTPLDQDAYTALSKPGTTGNTTRYAPTDETLYNTTVMKYMMPADADEGHAPAGTHTHMPTHREIR